MYIEDAMYDAVTSATSPDTIKTIKTLVLFELTQKYLSLASRKTICNPLTLLTHHQGDQAFIQTWLSPGSYTISDLSSHFCDDNGSVQHANRLVEQHLTSCFQSHFWKRMREADGFDVWVAGLDERAAKDFPFVPPFSDSLSPVLKTIRDLKAEMMEETITLSEDLILDAGIKNHKTVILQLQQDEIDRQQHGIYKKNLKKLIQSWRDHWPEGVDTDEAEENFLVWIEQHQSEKIMEDFIRQHFHPDDAKSPLLAPFFLSPERKEENRQRLKDSTHDLFGLLLDISNHITCLRGPKILTVSIGRTVMVVDVDNYNRVGYSPRQTNLLYETIYQGLGQQGGVIIRHFTDRNTFIPSTKEKPARLASQQHLYGLVIDRYTVRPLSPDEIKMVADHHYEMNKHLKREEAEEYRSFNLGDKDEGSRY